MTATRAADPSAPPRRPAGTRTRAGNAMERTRAALLDGAARCAAERGLRRTAMGDVADAAGIAKATLYNHFRTRDSVWSALAARELERLDAACRAALADGGPAAALTAAARGAGEHPVVRRLRSEEPALLAAASMASGAPFWDDARTRLAALLRQPAAGVEVAVVLRWVVSHALVEAAPGEAQASASLLAQALAAQARDSPSAVAPSGRNGNPRRGPGPGPDANRAAGLSGRGDAVVPPDAPMLPFGGEPAEAAQAHEPVAGASGAGQGAGSSRLAVAGSAGTRS